MKEPVLKKQLLHCPNCLQNGNREILGEVTDDGFVVLRFHRGPTIIRGSFSVACGVCGYSCYYRMSYLTTQRKRSKIEVAVKKAADTA